MACVKDIISIMNGLAPEKTQCDFDNCGLQLGRLSDPVKCIYLCLDPTPADVRRAADAHADMMITHHPLLFSPVKQISDEKFSGDVLLQLARHGISLYSSHTCLDAATGGVNDVLCSLLQLENVRGFAPQYGEGENTVFSCRIGQWHGKSIVQAGEFVKNAVNASHVHICSLNNNPINSVAVCSGSGSGMVSEVIREAPDAFLTGELKHSALLELTSAGITTIEAGHFQTEVPVMKSLFSYLQNRLNELQYKVVLILSDKLYYTEYQF